MKHNFFKLGAIFLASTCLISEEALADKVNRIIIDGNLRIEEATIKNYLEVKPGEEFTDDKKINSVKKLYSTSLFENISIDFKHGTLHVHVQEMPLITKIEFIGNNRIKNNAIKKEIISNAGSTLNNYKLKTDIERIKELYRKSGRYSIKVEAKVEKQDSNRAKLIFNIAEGPKTGIRNINFNGNGNYKDSELRSVILTKQSAWFRFLDSSDTYDPERIEYDRHLLKEFYNSIGYADFRVISAIVELSPTKEHFTLTFNIHEGKKYNYGKIEAESRIKEVAADIIEKYININSGKIYNSSELQKIADKITEKLGDMGYSQAVVYPEQTKNPETNTVDVKFVIEAASKIYINKINIHGNLKTKDHVIRRQFKINEGDLFNRSSINKGEQNLRNLDYFETVEVEASAADKVNHADINVKVEEKSTSSIQFEIGYNTAEGMVGRVNFTERNLIGTGQYLNAGVDKYRRKISYHIGLTDPYFMDKDLLAGITFFNTNAKGSGELPYALKTIGGVIRAGYDIATDLGHDINYSLRKDELNTRNNSSSHFISEQIGKYTTSSLGHTVTFDQTDSKIVPKNGYIVSGTQTYAGLGGNSRFLKHEVEGKIFKSVMNNQVTFKLSGEAGEIHGVGGKKVRMNERFNLGDFSFRGFAPSGIGPRDKRTNEALGGQKYYTLTGEVLFPIGFPKEFNVSGSVFTDFGSLWDFDVIKPEFYNKNDVYNSKTPRLSVGMGIVWVTRFAPIRLDYAYPIHKKKYDEKQHWHFRFSTSF